MSRPALAEINLQALRHNFALLANQAAPAQCYAVIKADGYGHGIQAVAKALTEAPKFAVACLEEARAIRSSQINKPILLLEGLFADSELQEAAALGLEVMIHDAAQLERVMAWQGPQPLSVWLKVNTGMNRLGLPPAQVISVVHQVQSCAQLRLMGCMTHFASADEEDLRGAQRQWHRMQEVRQVLPKNLLCAAANSAAILAMPEVHADWVRPGIALYGSSPFLHLSIEELGLRPVMRLRSSLIAVRDIQAGDAVGYGATWTATEATRMGVIAIGYADGYPRHAPAGTPVSVNGVRVELIGRVSMDMITVDLRRCPQAQVGDPVELWGDVVSVDEVAAKARTIGYELLTGVTARVPRVYHDTSAS